MSIWSGVVRSIQRLHATVKAEWLHYDLGNASYSNGMLTGLSSTSRTCQAARPSSAAMSRVLASIQILIGSVVIFKGFGLPGLSLVCLLSVLTFPPARPFNCDQSGRTRMGSGGIANRVSEVYAQLFRSCLACSRCRRRLGLQPLRPRRWDIYSPLSSCPRLSQGSGRRGPRRRGRCGASSSRTLRHW